MVCWKWCVWSTLLLTAVACEGAPEGSVSQPLGAVTPAAEVLGLSAQSRTALEGAPMARVLVLPERFAAESFVTSGPRWYAISWHEDGLTVSLHATDNVHAELSPQELERIVPAFEEVRGQPARTTLNEQIRAVTWTEDGVAFSLEVECYNAFTDRRCTDPFWALDLADELAEVRQ